MNAKILCFINRPFGNVDAVAFDCTAGVFGCRIFAMTVRVFDIDMRAERDDIGINGNDSRPDVCAEKRLVAPLIIVMGAWRIGGCFDIDRFLKLGRSGLLLLFCFQYNFLCVLNRLGSRFLRGGGGLCRWRMNSGQCGTGEDDDSRYGGGTEDSFSSGRV